MLTLALDALSGAYYPMGESQNPRSRSSTDEHRHTRVKGQSDANGCEESSHSTERALKRARA